MLTFSEEYHVLYFWYLHVAYIFFNLLLPMLIRLPCELWVPKLHNHHKQVQRANISCQPMLRRSQGIRLPILYVPQWWQQQLRIDHVHLHQPLWQVPTRPVLQRVQGRQVGAFLRRCPPKRYFRCKRWGTRSIACVDCLECGSSVIVPLNDNSIHLPER